MVEPLKMTLFNYTYTLNLDENNRIEVRREDTDKESIHHIFAWKNGELIHKLKDRYNIMYDYYRWQHWWHGQLIRDYVSGLYNYGHLMEEGYDDVTYFENNFEPVNPLGCELYQIGDQQTGLTIPEMGVEISVTMGSKPDTHITIERLSDHGRTREFEWFEEYKREFDPVKAREKRMGFFTEKDKDTHMTYSEWLRTEVPIDMSMVD